MVATKEEIAEMEVFFAGRELPRELHINPGIKVLNLQAFIALTLHELKDTDIRDAVLRPRWMDLLAIRRQLENTL